MSVQTRRKRPHAVKFMEKVRVDDSGCWLWQGFIEVNGYGYYRHEQTSWAHRASWLIFRGPIPEGLQLDHLCRVKACVNPKHLEPVTNGENQRRAKPWTTCAEFHPAEPSRFATRADGRQFCRECNRVREQQRRDRRAAFVTRLTHASQTESPSPSGLGL